MSPGKSDSKSSTELTIECGPQTTYVHDIKAPVIFRRAGVTKYMKDPRRRGVWMCPSSALLAVIHIAEKVQRREVNLVEVTR